MSACICGYDAFNADHAATRMWEFPSPSAAAWLEAYLDWAEAERPTRYFVVRADARPVDWAAGFAALASPPSTLLPASEVQGVTLQTIQPIGIEQHTIGHFWGWAQLSGDARLLTYLALPDDVRPALAAATERAVAALPKDAATPRVLVSQFGFERDESLAANIGNRSDCFFAPFGERSDGPTWLNVSAVDPYALAVCERLLHSIAETLGGLEATTDRSWQVAQSQAIDRVWGRAALGHALREILAVGYEQGIQAVLLAHLGRTWAADQPWLEPVVEYQGRGRTLEAIRVAWVPCQRGPVRKTVPSSPTMTRPSRFGRQGTAMRRRKRISKVGRRRATQIKRARRH